MTKKRMTEIEDNFVTEAIKRREAKDGKRIRQGLEEKDIFDFTYMSISNQKDLEILYENSDERDNEMLREIQGFEKDSNGVLVLKTEDYNIDRDNNGEKVRIKDNKIIKMNRNIVSLDEKRKEKEQEENYMGA